MQKPIKYPSSFSSENLTHMNWSLFQFKNGQTIKATLTILSVDYIMCLASNAPMTSAVVPLLMMK